MQFLHFNVDGSPELRGHPKWRDENGRLSADALVDMGYGLKVLDLPPTPPSKAHIVKRNPISQWELGDRTATVTYTVELPGVRREKFPKISPRQLRLALYDAGKNAGQIDAALQNRARDRIEWEYANEFSRTHPLIDQMAQVLQLTPEQVDALWATAATL